MRFLPNGYMLCPENICGSYKVTGVIGSGAATIAYLAEFCDENGLSHEHILKEYYPEKTVSGRSGDGALIIAASDENDFSAGKEKFISAVKTQSKLRRKAALTNQTPPVERFFEANNTVYADIVLFAGDTFDKAEKLTLEKRIDVCLAVARLVKIYHASGYLCLDIKPQNIFVLKETADIVELIDFGSVCLKSETRGGNFSFTKEWAAPELLNPRNFGRISEKTDIYAIGELVFFSVFKRHSATEEHRGFSEYPFDDGIRNTVKNLLTELFRKTLRTSVSNRYENCAPLIKQLEKISAELKKKEFIIDHAVYKSRYFIGREREISELAQKLENSGAVFVCGMGGIGKSAVIREYLSRSKSAFDIMLYLDFDGSVKKTVADDIRLQISSFEKSEHENETEYFERKIKKIRELIYGRPTIIVIDNFEGEADKDLRALLCMSWKIIIATRQNVFAGAFESMDIGAISERRQLYALFENYSGKKVSYNNISALDNIIDKICGHTLVLELIARQVARSYLTIAEASALADKYGFTDIAPEKVDLIKDNEMYHGTIRSIITALFAVDKLSEKKQTLLKAVSLFGDGGINIRTLSDLIRIDNYDEINSLYDDGWIKTDGGIISMHPVIRETLHCLEWSPAAAAAAFSIADRLCELVKPQEDAHAAAMRDNDVSCDSVIDILSNKRSLSDRLENLKRKSNYYYISLAQQVVKSCERADVLKSSDHYKRLLADIIINIPRDRKDYITENAGTITDGGFSDSERIMKVYRKVITVLLDCYDTDGAERWLEKARVYAAENGSDYVIGFYFDILTGYFDARLNGEYDTNNEPDDLGNQLKCTEEAIKHLKKATEHDSAYLLACCMLSRANLLIRSGAGGKAEIKRLLNEAGRMLKSMTCFDFELRRDFYLVSAWYYTYVEENSEKAVHNVLKGCAEAARSFAADLDLVDEAIIPAANILLENGFFDESARLLEAGAAICELYSGAEPLDNRKTEIYGYMLDVYNAAGDKRKYKELKEKLKQDEIERC